MALNFTFADNQRLGLQIVGANSTGTSEQPRGFKRAVVDNDNNVAGEVIYLGRGNDAQKYVLGKCGAYYCDRNGFTHSQTEGTPLFGVYIKDGNADYIQTGGVAYVQVEAPLTKGAKIYYKNGLVSPSNSGTIEIKGAVAGDPNKKISVKIKGTPTDLYPIYLNNPHL